MADSHIYSQIQRPGGRMNRAWQVHEAKARFSEFLDASVRDGPQIVTRRGVETAVLLPIAQWRKSAEGGEARSNGPVARLGSQNGDAHPVSRTAPFAPGIGSRVDRCTFSTRTSSRNFVVPIRTRPFRAGSGRYPPIGCSCPPSRSERFRPASRLHASRTRRRRGNSKAGSTGSSRCTLSFRWTPSSSASGHGSSTASQTP